MNLKTDNDDGTATRTSASRRRARLPGSSRVATAGVPRKFRGHRAAASHRGAWSRESRERAPERGGPTAHRKTRLNDEQKRIFDLDSGTIITKKNIVFEFQVAVEIGMRIFKSLGRRNEHKVFRV